MTCAWLKHVYSSWRCQGRKDALLPATAWAVPQPLPPKLLLPWTAPGSSCWDLYRPAPAPMQREMKIIFSPYFTSKSVYGMYLEICWSNLIIQLIGRWVNFFFVKPCKVVNGFRILQAQYQLVRRGPGAADSLFFPFLFSLYTNREVNIIYSFYKEETVSSVLKAVT